MTLEARHWSAFGETLVAVVAAGAGARRGRGRRRRRRRRGSGRGHQGGSQKPADDITCAHGSFLSVNGQVRNKHAHLVSVPGSVMRAHGSANGTGNDSRTKRV